MSERGQDSPRVRGGGEVESEWGKKLEWMSGKRFSVSGNV